MSYSLSLIDPITREPLAKLAITRNHGGHFRTTLGAKGIREIYSMTGHESIPVLKAAIAELNDDVNPNYWRVTEGNAKRALRQLCALAEMRPDGVWEGD